MQVHNIELALILYLGTFQPGQLTYQAEKKRQLHAVAIVSYRGEYMVGPSIASAIWTLIFTPCVHAQFNSGRQRELKTL